MGYIGYWTQVGIDMICFITPCVGLGIGIGVGLGSVWFLYCMGELSIHHPSLPRGSGNDSCNVVNPTTERQGNTETNVNSDWDLIGIRQGANATANTTANGTTSLDLDSRDKKTDQQLQLITPSQPNVPR